MSGQNAEGRQGDLLFILNVQGDAFMEMYLWFTTVTDDCKLTRSITVGHSVIIICRFHLALQEKGQYPQGNLSLSKKSASFNPATKTMSCTAGRVWGLRSI
jgi:hypothetical protein